MADTITISTSSMDSERIVRIPLSGGTGTGWTLATGSKITGLTIANTTDTTVYNVASSSFSGNDLLVTVYGYLPSGKTLTVDLAAGAGSNLRDGGGNRPQGNAGVSITNTSSVAATNFASSHAGIGKLFYGTNGSGLGSSMVYEEITIPASTDAQIVLTDWAPGLGVSVSIDGAAEADTGVVSVGDVGARVFPLFNGLSAVSRTARIRYRNVNLTIPASRHLQTSGAGAPTLPATYGPSYGARSQSGVTVDGAPASTGGSTGVNEFLAYECLDLSGLWVRMKATITSIRFLVAWQAGAGGVCKINLLRRASGSAVGTAWTYIGQATATLADNDYYFTTTISSLDGGTEYDYLAVCLGPSTFRIGGWAVTGTGMNTTALTSQGFVVVIGDSIEHNQELADASEGLAYKISIADGFSVYNAASPGEQMNATAASRYNTVFGTTITNQPIGFWGCEGVNNGINESSGDPTELQAGWTSTLDNISTAWPDLPGVVFGIYPSAASTPITTHPITDPAIAAAVATQAAVAFYSSDGVINTTKEPTAGADLISDGVHPNAGGHTKLADFQGPKVASQFFVDPSLPEVPANLAVAASGAAINGTFDRSTDYADFTDLSYEVYRSTDNVTYTFLTSLADAASPSFSDSSVLANTAYYYKVAAVSNEFGSSALSSEQHTTSNNVPGAPVLDAVTGLEVGGSGILVEPTAPASTGGSAIIFYRFYRKRIGINAAFVLAKTLAAADLASHWLDTGTAVDDVVDYKVTAVNAVGESAASATREATSQGPLTGHEVYGGGFGIGLTIGM